MKLQPQTTSTDRIIITRTERRALLSALTDVLNDPPSQMPTWQMGLRLPLTELRDLLLEERRREVGVLGVCRAM